MTDYTKFQEINDKIMALGEIPIAKTQEEWLFAYKKLMDSKKALADIIHGNKDSDVISYS